MILSQAILAGMLSLQAAPAEAAHEVPQLQEDAFQRAEALVRLAGRTSGAMEWRLLGEAARLYALDYRGGAEGPLAAEAALRHGRVLERLGRVGPARGAWHRATELASDGGRRAAARLAVADSFRRTADWRRAAKLYLEVVLDPGSPRAALAEAWRWRGRCQQELGELSEAELSFAAWQASAERLQDEIHAIDARACASFDQGRHRVALWHRDTLYQRCAPLLDPSTAAGRELFRRLDGMALHARIRACAWANGADSNDESNRHRVGVAERQPHLADSVTACHDCRLAVQSQLGGSPAIRDHLKVLEANSTRPTRPQHLHSGLLGGHASGIVHARVRAALTLFLLRRGEHPVPQRWTSALESSHESGDVDQVDADSRQVGRQRQGHRGGA